MSALASGTRKKASLKENNHPINEITAKIEMKNFHLRSALLASFNVAHVTFKIYNSGYILLYQYSHFGSCNFRYCLFLLC